MIASFNHLLPTVLAPGMTKVEAQIEYLKLLRTWCPFYGCSMYEVDCQYDCIATDDHHVPPVIQLTAAVGARGIYLISTTELNEQTLMLHSYSKILKYRAYTDQSIFIYWTVKSTTDSATVCEAMASKGDAFNADLYCDKVYLVSDRCAEIEFLVRTYVELEKDKTRPQLPGASAAYLLCEGFEEGGEGGEGEEGEKGEAGEGEGGGEREEKPSPKSVATEIPIAVTEEPNEGKEGSSSPLLEEEEEEAVIFCSMLHSAGDSAAGAQHFGDDTGGVANSIFKDLYGSAPTASTKNSSEIELKGSEVSPALEAVPTVKLATTMEDLQQKSIASGIFSFSSSDEEGDGQDSEGEGEGGAGSDSSAGDALGGEGSSDDGEILAFRVKVPPAIAGKMDAVAATGGFSKLFKWGS
jgi:hypothetical protein